MALLQSILAFLIAGVVLASAQDCAKVASQKLPECIDMIRIETSGTQVNHEDMCRTMNNSINCMKNFTALQGCEENSVVELLKLGITRFESYNKQICQKMASSYRCADAISKKLPKCTDMLRNATNVLHKAPEEHLKMCKFTEEAVKCMTLMASSPECKKDDALMNGLKQLAEITVLHHNQKCLIKSSDEDCAKRLQKCFNLSVKDPYDTCRIMEHRMSCFKMIANLPTCDEVSPQIEILMKQLQPTYQSKCETANATREACIVKVHKCAQQMAKSTIANGKEMCRIVKYQLNCLKEIVESSTCDSIGPQIGRVMEQLKPAYQSQCSSVESSKKSCFELSRECTKFSSDLSAKNLNDFCRIMKPQLKCYKQLLDAPACNETRYDIERAIHQIQPTIQSKCETKNSTSENCIEKVHKCAQQMTKSSKTIPKGKEMCRTIRRQLSCLKEIAGSNTCNSVVPQIERAVQQLQPVHRSQCSSVKSSNKSCHELLPECLVLDPGLHAKSLSERCRKAELLLVCLENLLDEPTCKELRSLIGRSLHQTQQLLQSTCGSKLDKMECFIKINAKLKKCDAKSKQLMKEMEVEEPKPSSDEKKESEDNEDTEKFCKGVKEVVGCFEDAFGVDGCEDIEIFQRQKDDVVKSFQREFLHSRLCSSAALLHG